MTYTLLVNHVKLCTDSLMFMCFLFILNYQFIYICSHNTLLIEDQVLYFETCECLSFIQYNAYRDMLNPTKIKTHCELD